MSVYLAVMEKELLKKNTDSFQFQSTSGLVLEGDYSSIVLNSEETTCYLVKLSLVALSSQYRPPWKCRV